MARRKKWATIQPWMFSVDPGYPSRWTAAQKRVFGSPYSLTVVTGGNGVGKSVTAAEIARRGVMGLLPWHPGPTVVMLVGNTYGQLSQTLEYLFAGVPPGTFPDGVRYEGGQVRGQRLTIFDVVGGQGAGGKLILGTFRAENLAGHRADLIVTDEPLPRDVFDELWARLAGRQGRIYTFFTPTLRTWDSASYLWKLIDDESKGWAGEIRIPLDLEAVTPLGSDVADLPWMTQPELDELAQGWSNRERKLRLGLSREPAFDEAYFKLPENARRIVPIPEGAQIYIGIDHGTRPGAERISMLVGWVSDDGPHIHVWRHWHSPFDGDPPSDREIVEALVAMVESAGPDIGDIDAVFGDRTHYGHRGDRWGAARSNRRLQKEIAVFLGIAKPQDETWKWMHKLPDAWQNLRVPKKYLGSVWDGVETLQRLITSRRMTFDPDSSVDQVYEDFRRWMGGYTEPAKDGIDSVRYAAIPLLEKLAPTR